MRDAVNRFMHLRNNFQCAVHLPAVLSAPLNPLPCMLTLHMGIIVPSSSGFFSHSEMHFFQTRSSFLKHCFFSFISRCCHNHRADKETERGGGTYRDMKTVNSDNRVNSVNSVTVTE